MKRSLLDPLPRPLSTQTLVVLVALVVLGTGVAVARFLETAAAPAPFDRPAVQAAPPRMDASRLSPAERAGPWGGLSSGVRPAASAYSSAGGWAPSAAAPARAGCAPTLRDAAPTVFLPDGSGT